MTLLLPTRELVFPTRSGRRRRRTWPRSATRETSSSKGKPGIFIQHAYYWQDEFSRAAKLDRCLLTDYLIQGGCWARRRGAAQTKVADKHWVQTMTIAMTSVDNDDDNVFVMTMILTFTVNAMMCNCALAGRRNRSELTFASASSTTTRTRPRRCGRWWRRLSWSWCCWQQD